jgi:hypothetical protein
MIFFFRPGGAALAIALITAFVFSSCLGIASDTVIRRDGSGTMTLEYRISRELESLGKLDGNERWLPLPAGKADLDRTAARIEGLTLSSFSTKTTEQDIINKAKLDFTNLNALVRFLDGTGQRAVLVREGEKTGLTLSFGGSSGTIDGDLLTLASAALKPYSLEFGLTLPGEPVLRILDGNGGVLDMPHAGTLSVRGTRVAFSSPMADLLSSTPVTLELLW